MNFKIQGIFEFLSLTPSMGKEVIPSPGSNAIYLVSVGSNCAHGPITISVGVRTHKWVKVFKNGPSKICER